MTTLRFASWSAVSSNPQAEKISLEDQHSENERVAAGIGTVTHRLTVPGESRGEGAGLYERGDYTSQVGGKGQAYRELESLALAGDIDVVIFRGMDRLARSFAGAIAWCDWLNRHGVALYDREMPPSTLDAASQQQDVMSMITRAFGAAKGQSEITEIKRRNRVGMADRVNRGLFPNKPPDGYTYDGEGNAVATDRLEFIRLGFEMYLSGSSTIDIEQHFNSIGFTRVRGGKWPENGSIWRNYLNRRYVYAGYVEHNKRIKGSEKGEREYIRARGSHPAILDDKQVREIETLMETYANAPAARRLFSGVVRCRSCDMNMHSLKNGDGYVSYRCSKSEGGCGRSRSERLLKVAFLDAVRQLADNPDQITMMIERAGYDQGAVDQMALLEGQLEAVERKRKRVKDAYADEVFTLSDLREQLENLDSQEADILVQRARLVMPKRTPDETRALIEEYIDTSEKLMDGSDDKGSNADLRNGVVLLVDFDMPETEVRFG